MINLKQNNFHKINRKQKIPKKYRIKNNKVNKQDNFKQLVKYNHKLVVKLMMKQNLILINLMIGLRRMMKCQWHSLNIWIVQI